MSDQTEGKQNSHLFKPGQSGNPNGRPKGARSKLSEAFLKDVLADWEASGAEVLRVLRAERPDVYVKVISELLPKEVSVNGSVEHEHRHEHRAVSETAAWIAGVLGERAEGASSEPLPH